MWSWYVRIGLYVLLLVVATLALNSLRGRIPMMLGATPIRIDGLATVRLPHVGPGAADTADVGVTVRIVARKPVRDGLRLDQFRLRAKSGKSYPAHTSSFIFGPSGVLAVDKGDTLIGTFVFALPKGEAPDELWWRP